MWGLGRDNDGRPPSEDRADDQQGDLRWRLFRAAGELQDKAGCSLMLVPPRRQEPPPDFVQRNIFLTKYLRIHPCPHGDDEWEDGMFGLDDDGDFDFY